MDLTHWIAEGRRAAESDRETCARGAYPVPADEAEESAASARSFASAQRIQ
jgi:hypothetical protein